MPIISTLKSSRTRERRVLVKEETEAQKLLQENYSNNLEDVTRLHMVVGKVLLNLEVKLPRLESAGGGESRIAQAPTRPISREKQADTLITPSQLQEVY